MCILKVLYRAEKEGWKILFPFFLFSRYFSYHPAVHSFTPYDSTGDSDDEERFKIKDLFF